MSGRNGRSVTAAAMAAIGIVVLMVGGCTDDERPRRKASTPAAGARTDDASAEASESSRTSQTSLPSPGRFEILLGRRGITVLGNNADLLPLLSRLANRLEFRLQLGELTLPSVTVRIEDQPIELVLPELLAGLPYKADYGLDKDSGKHRLRALRVGTGKGGGADETAAAPAREERRKGKAGRQGRSPEAEERLRRYRRQRAEQDEEQAGWIAQLDSRDPTVREEAVYEIDPEGAGLPVLVDLAREDPDPDVRIAAVSQLEDSDTHVGVQGLISALEDDDRRVVLEAIDALEFAGDESIIPHLEPLVNSRDSEISEAAEEAIEFLE